MSDLESFHLKASAGCYKTLPAMPSPASSLSIYSTHPVLQGEVAHASSLWNLL